VTECYVTTPIPVAVRLQRFACWGCRFESS